MNLHGIVSGAIGAVNPFVTVGFRASTGYTKGSDFSQIPSYAPTQNILAQIQALEDDELKQVDSLNIQGVKRAIYINGLTNGVIRVSQKGGDLFTFADGTVWKVILVLEYWPDWCKAALVLQDGS